jgi:myo-inositol-1(or 4)-monophosphatase
VQLSDLRAESRAAIEAVRAALRIVRDRVDVTRVTEKGPLDIATGTDLASQAAIATILKRSHPEHGFVGEEDGEDRAPSAPSYWLVDPICGTRNFAARVPVYAVNIALVQDRRVTVAAVGDGAAGAVWVAERGRGTWLVHGDALARVRATDASGLVLLDPGRPGGPAAGKASAVIGAAIRRGRWELRMLGSSLDLAYLADGRLAGVWHFTRIPPLHFAAGTLVASEAGALVTDETGRPWDLESQSLIGAATRATHDALLSLLD